MIRVHPNHTDIVVEFIMTQTYDLGVYNYGVKINVGYAGYYPWIKI